MKDKTYICKYNGKKARNESILLLIDKKSGVLCRTYFEKGAIAALIYNQINDFRFNIEVWAPYDG